MSGSIPSYPKFIGTSQDVNDILSSIADSEGYHGKIVLREEKYYFVESIQKGDKILKLSQIMDIFIKNPKESIAGTFNQRKERLKSFGAILERKESKLNRLSPVTRKIYEWFWKTESTFQQEKAAYNELKEEFNLDKKKKRANTEREEAKRDQTTPPTNLDTEQDRAENRSHGTRQTPPEKTQSLADLERALVLNTVSNSEMAKEHLSSAPAGSYRVWTDADEDKIYLLRKVLDDRGNPILKKNIFSYDQKKVWIAKIHEILKSPSNAEEIIESDDGPSNEYRTVDLINELFMKNIINSTKREDVLTQSGFKKLIDVVGITQVRKMIFKSPEEDQRKIFSTLKSIGEKLAAGVSKDEYVAEVDEETVLKKGQENLKGFVETEAVKEKNYAYIITKENEIYLIHKELTRGGTKIISEAISLKDLKEYISAVVTDDITIAEAQQEAQMLEAIAKSNCSEIVKPYFVKILGKEKKGQSALVMLQHKYDGDGYKLRKKEPKLILDVAIDWAGGLNFLHDNNMVHSDVKPGNILIEQMNGKVKARVSDLGLANKKGKNFSKGTAIFLPPEAVIRKGDQLFYNRECILHPSLDCFSFGVSLFYLISNVKSLQINGNYFAIANQKQIDEEIDNHIIAIRKDRALSLKDQNIKIGILMVAKQLLKVDSKARMDMNSAKRALKEVRHLAILGTSSNSNRNVEDISPPPPEDSLEDSSSKKTSSLRHKQERIISRLKNSPLKDNLEENPKLAQLKALNSNKLYISFSGDKLKLMQGRNEEIIENLTSSERQARKELDDSGNPDYRLWIEGNQVKMMIKKGISFNEIYDTINLGNLDIFLPTKIETILIKRHGQKIDNAQKIYVADFASKLFDSSTTTEQLNKNFILQSLFNLIKINPSDVNGEGAYIFKEDKLDIERRLKVLQYDAVNKENALNRMLDQRKFQPSYDKNMNDALLKIKYNANLIDKSSGKLFSNATSVEKRPYLMMEQIGVEKDDYLEAITGANEDPTVLEDRWDNLLEEEKENIKINVLKEEIKKSLAMFLTANHVKMPRTLLIPFNYDNHSMFLTIEQDPTTKNWHLTVVDSRGNVLENLKSNILDGCRETLSDFFRNIKIEVRIDKNQRTVAPNSGVHFQLDAEDLIEKIESRNLIGDLLNKGQPIFSHRNKKDLEIAIKKDKDLAHTSLGLVSSIAAKTRHYKWLRDLGRKYGDAQPKEEVLQELLT